MKFGFCEAVCDIFDRFVSLNFQNEIQPFARFTEYRIYNHRNWFVGSENMQIPDFFDQITSSVKW